MGVLLAAGGGSRFRAGVDAAPHKLHADLGGRPLWQHSVDHLVAARLDEVVVITGAAPFDPPGVTVVHNGTSPALPTAVGRADVPTLVRRLSLEALRRLEAEDGEAAGQFHRFVVNVLASRLTVANEAVRAAH